MRYNYLPNSEDDSLVNYSFKLSYLQNEKTQNKSGVNSYQLLPEEYDVFSIKGHDDILGRYGEAQFLHRDGSGLCKDIV